MSNTRANFQSRLNDQGLSLFRHNLFPAAYRIWRLAHTLHATTTFDSDWCRALDLLGLQLNCLDRNAQAEPYLRAALAEKERTLPPGNSMINASVMNLARVLGTLPVGKYEEAEALWRRAVGYWIEREGVSGENVMQSWVELAAVLYKQDREEKVKEAERLARRVLGHRERILGGRHYQTLECVWLVGSIVEKKGSYEEALGCYERAYEGASQVLGEGHADTQDYLCDLLRLRE
ncbi:uncharacterized protein K460DRAFT_410028 [Cucurbitaria berberidis CBS 394.84]|uniref:TPR-like protein n=1 Tax=Cucurbitaria berberidis CBS 394.84 TaxID=1168544 RepID=A0A9P4L5G7_9PLEO|nr:uncharacterized protein K460DRAFT_410028 [Cucurbitaria berberidis CBS 394.84]KAF1842630.1 hypothetical protein K460DRAFT_410028 [Cucurbitaria berberidis CBS 394.84]